MKNTFFWLIFLITGIPSYATHIIGGDLKYVCTGEKKYQFTLTVYSECGSAAQLDPKYNIFFFSTSQGISAANAKSFVVYQISENEEIVFCPSQISNCNATGSARGIKRVTYVGSVDLTAYSFAKDWVFYWKKSYRSEEINTLVLAEEEDFFVKVEMNSVEAPCNNSPSFQNNAVITACLGEDRTYNPVALDSDGDVLVYSLVPPLSDLDVAVTYQDGYNFNKFITLASPATINSTTGDMFFHPKDKQQVGITDVMVKEYRNGKLIGSSVRSMQISSLDCNNKVPVLTNFNETGRDSITVYSGDKVDLTIAGNDPDGQNVTMTQLKGKSGVFSTVGNNTVSAKGRFIWQTYYFEAGKYFFTIELKDDGCPRPQISTKTYIIEVLPRYIKVDFNENPRCEGQEVKFKDVSFSYDAVLTGNLNKWEWFFGDGTFSNIQHPSHIFTKAGKYPVKLVVSSDKGYKDSLTKVVEICGVPAFDFKGVEMCSYNSVFEDFTPELKDCEVLKRGWDFGDGTSDTIYHYDCEPRLAYHNYGALPGNLPKEFEVRLTTITFSGCKYTSLPIKITINPSPIVDILESEVVFDCSNPVVQLHSQILANGAGGLSYLWSTGETTPDITVHSRGLYTLTVTDQSGCFSKDEVRVISPVKAKFIETKFCSPGQSIAFTDKSISQNPAKPIISWKWDFGDGTASTEQNPVHLYSNFGDYNVKLRVTDVDGCDDEITHPIFNTYFTERFEIPSNPICVNNAIQINGPVFKSSEHFESVQWDFGNGRISFDQNPYTIYSSPGTYEITLKVNYNRQYWDASGQACSPASTGCLPSPGCSSTVCEKVFKQTIKVNPELKVEIDPFRVCVDEEVQLSFKRTAGDLTIPIINAKWKIYSKETDSTTVVDSLTPSYVFNKGSNGVELTVEDALGCWYTTPFLFRTTETVMIPDFTSDVVCANTPTTFTANFKDLYENVQEVEWDFGNNQLIRKPYKRPMTEEHTFTQGGTYPVKLTAYSFTGCSQSKIIDVQVHHLPAVDFGASTVCAKEPLHFTNKTSIVSQVKLSYRWDFGDGNTSSEENPTHVYSSAGSYTVRLSALSETGCSDFAEKQVYIKEGAKADFEMEETVLSAFSPLHFVNTSEGDIVEYYWDFGDGGSSTEKNPIHSYKEIKLYNVKLIVINREGCSDTIIKKNNLNVHAEIPSAFSPNGDGANDNFSLLSNGITELQEFKIYNRWGELVFDAGNNLKASWDGTFRGKPQEIGVYVVYVRAVGVYDTKINYKMNITLLR